MTIRAISAIATYVILSFFSFSAVGDEAAAEGGALDAGEALKRAATAAKARQSKAAVEWATKAIDTGAAEPIAFYLRGRERLRLGEFEKSVADFDRYRALRPVVASRLWERGIPCYYAKQFQAGADQFRAYQTYHGNDVENAVWHVVCLAPLIGFEQAQAKIMPIESDNRIPMMEIYRLFGGEAEPQEVMEATQRGNPTPQQLNDRLMYANLYLGLYHESKGEFDQSLKYLETAAKKHRNDNYMWDVARVHAKSRRKSEALNSQP